MYCNNKYKKNAYKKWHPNLCYKPTCPKCPDVDPPEEPSGLYIFEQKGGYYTSFNDVGGTPKTDKTQQEITDTIYNIQQTNEFGKIIPNRYAICFLPGVYTYSSPVNVGFYTTLSGLGLTPANVIINSMNNGKENPVRCADRYAATFLDNFWRSCENMTLKGEKTFWYVSQAAPLNNMIIEGNLYLAGTEPPPDPNPTNINDYASGGFIGNSIINGYGVTDGPPPVSSVAVYSQQQWCNLNSSFNKFSNTVWNLTNIGCTGNLDVRGTPPDGSVTQIEKTPKIAGKPYLYYDGTVFQIVKPSVKPDIKGPLPLTDLITDYTLIDNIYYANPNELNEIQNKIDEGFSIVLTPGIYNLTDTITISKDGIIILGLGMATLVAPSNGGQAILVEDNVNDLRLSSFIIQANKDNIDPKPETPVLLQIGKTSNNQYQTNAIFLDNIFIKVGPELIIAPSETPDTINVDTMLIINTNGVVASNLWLWRADHGPYGSIIGTSKCNNGLIVNGDNVNIYGLFVEHASVNLIQWKGANGKLYFLQSEYPYDAASDFNQPCLTVTGNVFEGQALGVYCYFRDNQVTVPKAISCPESGVKIKNAFTVFLNYNPLKPETEQSEITHVVNETGKASVKSTIGNPQYVLLYP